MSTSGPDASAPFVTRFAPSPTGLLHVGHAYAALFAERAARAGGGHLILRIEDIDAGRCRPQFEEAIYQDLAWLGLAWEEPVRRQSDHMDDYAGALARLDGLGLLYPCFCTRREVAAEIARAGHAPHGPDGPLYPGTCRGLSPETRATKKAAGTPSALRLDTKRAAEVAGPLEWHDGAAGTAAAEPNLFGDVVLARKDTPTSYHLAVTLDDHLQGITLVTRGEDLFAATHLHRLLQALLGLDVPLYHHHPMLADEAGRRLAKRHRSLTIQALRDAGKSPAEVRQMAGFE
ncbi:MAG: tRNA glutamyl-Q(34) synthetase GluQRS [Rhodospirillales bacterium]|jgi:glutamyl-Q tRNA(Asp) synthetase|nr:tRNA glutamyl-Q(34) synthetase GluQRS [Rhodospirillales bacterium]MDP6773593.1 tRNA glutamyl-Q(34) synthetase GluQRS [Rhodospirillales bacterium]